MRYKIVNVVAFAILNACTLRKEEDEEDFVVGGVLLLTVVLFKDDEKRAVDKDTTEFETIINILLEERMHNELFESDEKREDVSKKPVFYVRESNFFRRKKSVNNPKQHPKERKNAKGHIFRQNVPKGHILLPQFCEKALKTSDTRPNAR